MAGANLLTLTQALATKNPANLNLSSGLNLGIAGKIGGQYILGAIASFFDSDKDANVLSTPNLLTLDNEEAKIVIGQNVPFVTGQFTNTGGAGGASTRSRPSSARTSASRCACGRRSARTARSR